MNKAQKEAIRRQFVYLVDNMADPRSSGLTNHLYQDEVIELRDRQIVEREKATQDAIQHLLDAVTSSKKTDAFDCFLKCLKECGHDYLADKIRSYTNSDVKEAELSQAIGGLVVGEITPTLVSQFQIKCSKDPPELPMVVDIMPGGDIVVGRWCTGDQTKHIIIICSSTGNIKQKIQVPLLSGLAALRSGTIAATVWGDSTQEVRIYTKDGTVTSSFPCEKPGRLTVNYEGHLVVLCGALERNGIRVVAFGTDGRLIRMFTDISAEPILNDEYITTSPSGDIIVSYVSDRCIRVYTPEGRLQYTYDGEDAMKLPRGVCVDGHGNIFIADLISNNIHQVSPSGQFIRHVLTGNDGLCEPRDVCINHQGHLIVAQGDGWIKTYKYK